MLLKSALLDADSEEIAAIGPLELQQLLAAHQQLSAPLQTLLDDYIRYVYADDTLPPPAEQRRWYRRVKSAVRKIK